MTTMFETPAAHAADTQPQGASKPQVRAGTWLDEIERLERVAPDWADDFNATDPIVAKYPEVQRLTHTAPDEFSRGLMMGINMVRCAIEAVSERPYRFRPDGTEYEAEQGGASAAA